MIHVFSYKTYTIYNYTRMKGTEIINQTAPEE
uniref:Uncharacterized protein n=1 Tax=Anguilla anguilla TaxID=7936 RepID=A0A0E9RWW1_ANGAN